MKKEEEGYLYRVKKSSGKSEKVIYSEISYFKEYEKEKKRFVKELKKRDKVIEKLKEKIEKLSTSGKKIKKKVSLGNDVFRKDVKLIEEKDLNKYIRRIKSNIESGRVYSKTNIREDLMIPSRVLSQCINRLVSENFLKVDINSGRIKYIKE